MFRAVSTRARFLAVSLAALLAAVSPAQAQSSAGSVGPAALPLVVDPAALGAAPAVSAAPDGADASQNMGQIPAAPVAVVTSETRVLTPAPSPEPVTKKWWFWAALGGVAAASVAILVVANRAPAPPSTQLGNMEAFRNRP
jgi:hypothetical protein